MATKKAGKAKSRKPVARKPRKPVVRKAPVQAKVQTFPCKVIVSKGSERLPVDVKDAAHHAQLVEQFGESSVEVQS